MKEETVSVKETQKDESKKMYMTEEEDTKMGSNKD